MALLKLCLLKCLKLYPITAAGLFALGSMSQYVSKYINYSLVSKNAFEEWDVSHAVLGGYR